MCRFFAYVSESEEALLEDVLIDPKHSLAKQVNEHYLPKLFSHKQEDMTDYHEITVRNRLFNVDGFGLVWYTPTQTSFNRASHDTSLRPALYKTAQPPLHDVNFRSICANTSSTAVFAHIRAATAGVITSVNNHPFVFGRHAFMHNGAIADFRSICREIVTFLDDDAYANISGWTDSEHFGALYITYLTKGRGKASWEEEYPVEAMRDAMTEAVGTVIRLQKKMLGDKTEANSLNLAATDGTQLVTFRVRNHKTEQPPSLYWSTTAGVTMNRKFPDHPDGKENPRAHKAPKEHGSHVIVASEPSTYKEKEWNLIDKNHCVLVGKDGKPVIERIHVPEEWNATTASKGF